MKKMFFSILTCAVVFALSAGISSCGKKGPPVPKHPFSAIQTRQANDPVNCAPGPVVHFLKSTR